MLPNVVEITLKLVTLPLERGSHQMLLLNKFNQCAVSFLVEFSILCLISQTFSLQAMEYPGLQQVVRRTLQHMGTLGGN